jgi:DNA-binding response OmpR family regulator
VLGLATPAEHPAPAARETHILVELVTNDRSMSNQVRHLLLAENMDLIHSTSAERAIEVLERHSPDLIMLDAVSDDAPLAALLDHPVARRVPILLVTNDDALYERNHNAVAGRVRSNFRKSTLLSAIHNALNRGLGAFEPIGDKVLCIDDDPEILDFIQRCLAAEGFESETCHSGRDGVEKAASREFGLVLLDVAMPGMDGWETCRRIRKTPGIEGIKIYMVTAKPIDRNPSLLREAGADGFLLKPFRPEDLVQLVRGLEMRTTAK